jgi:hypothetical protein
MANSVFDPGLDVTGQVARPAEGAPDDAVTESENAPIDEQAWVDDLMASEVADPISVTEGIETGAEREDDR